MKNIKSLKELLNNHKELEIFDMMDYASSPLIDYGEGKEYKEAIKSKELVNLGFTYYCKPTHTPSSMLLPGIKEVKEFFVNNNKGMVVGSHMYEELGLSTNKDIKGQIYSNVSRLDIVTIPGYDITKIDVVFTPELVSMFRIFELVDNRRMIPYINITEYDKVLDNLVKESSLDQDSFMTVMSKKSYSTDTQNQVIELLFSSREKIIEKIKTLNNKLMEKALW